MTPAEMREMAAKVCDEESAMRKSRMDSGDPKWGDPMAQGHKAITAWGLAKAIRAIPIRDTPAADDVLEMTDERYMRAGVEFAVAKLIEELGELNAALGKTMRWGFHSVDPTVGAPRETNEDWVFREMDDVMGAISNLRREVAKTTPHQRASMFGYGNKTQ